MAARAVFVSGPNFSGTGLDSPGQGMDLISGSENSSNNNILVAHWMKCEIAVSRLVINFRDPFVDYVKKKKIEAENSVIILPFWFLCLLCNKNH